MEILAKVYSKTRIDFCNLCPTEKLFMINSRDNNQLLNKKNELYDTCRHRNRLLIKSLKRNLDGLDDLDGTFSLVLLMLMI